MSSTSYTVASLKSISVGISKTMHTYYRWTTLYARDRDCKNRLAYKEFAYKKTYNHCKIEDRFQKKRPCPIL